MKFSKAELVNANTVKIDFDEPGYSVLVQCWERESGIRISSIQTKGLNERTDLKGLKKILWQSEGPIFKSEHQSDGISKTTKKVLRCPSCDGIDIVACSVKPTTYKSKGVIHKCISCEAVFGHASCFKETLEYVKSEWHETDSKQENQCYFDLTYPDDDGKIHRRHGWFDKTTKRITQAG